MMVLDKRFGSVELHGGEFSHFSISSALIVQFERLHAKLEYQSDGMQAAAELS